MISLHVHWPRAGSQRSFSLHGRAVIALGGLVVGALLERRDDARSVRFRIDAPKGLARYIAHKGSICIDGVSLTVNAVQGSQFELNIVPHTIQETIISGYRAGSMVNLEVDQIARYLERLLLGDQAAESTETSGVTKELLARSGFMK